MRISCDKKLLMENINIVQKCVSSRTTNPILECILLKADRDGFRLIANDLEQSIETAPIESDVYSLGTVALNAKMFFDFVRTMPEGMIEISCDDNFVTVIKNGRTNINISGLDGSEFPLPKMIEDGEGVTVKGSELRSMIRQTIFSVAVGEYRPMLTGELFEFEGQRFNIVALDGHRIAYRTSFTEKELNKKLIVPGKALTEISRLIGDEEDVEMFFNEKFIEFRLKGCNLTSRLFEGNYVEYSRMFTNDYKTNIKIDKDALLSSLERCMLLIAREIKKVQVILEISDGVLAISAENSIGKVNDEIDIDFEGENIKIGFSPKYLIDICRAVDEKELNMFFLGSLSPCIVKSCVGNEDYKYLVLPVKIQ